MQLISLFALFSMYLIAKADFIFDIKASNETAPTGLKKPLGPSMDKLEKLRKELDMEYPDVPEGGWINNSPEDNINRYA